MNQPQTIDEPNKAKLHVKNIQRMKCFYLNTLDFKLIGEFPNAALLGITEKDDGRTHTIGLFKRSIQTGSGQQKVDRISFVVSRRDYRYKCKQLKQVGLKIDAKKADRIVVRDPEGNHVEFICLS